jgi:hypothetical protein
LSFTHLISSLAARLGSFGPLRRFLPHQPEFGGGPRTGRQKTYSAESGYVYQYVLSSFRQHRRGGEDLHEYTFEVSGGPGRTSSVAIVLKSSVLHTWIRQHDREFSASERYGIAKITLKRELDSADNPATLPASVSPNVNQVDDVCRFLGLL